MNIKDYLSQTWRINKMIDVKLEEVNELRALAEKASATLSMTPPSGTRNFSRMEDIIVKMVDLENEVQGDIENLLTLKKDITVAIRSLSNPDYKVLLELRYLCYKSWEEIMADMRYSRTHTYRIHERALKAIRIPQKDGTKMY